MSDEYDKIFAYSDHIQREVYEISEFLDHWHRHARHKTAHEIIDAGLIPIELPVITEVFYQRQPGQIFGGKPIPKDLIEQGHPWDLVEITYRVRCRRPVTP